MQDASLRVVGSGFDQTYPLPRTGWREVGPPNAYFTSFDYRSTGPVTLVKLRPKSGVRVTLSGSLGGSLLSDPSPVTIVLNTGRLRYCMTFGAAQTFKPGIKYLTRDAPAPAACPP